MKASSVYVVLGILSVSYCSAIPKPGEDEHKNRVHDKVCFYLLSLCSKPGEYDVRLFVVNTSCNNVAPVTNLCLGCSITCNGIPL